MNYVNHIFAASAMATILVFSSVSADYTNQNLIENPTYIEGDSLPIASDLPDDIQDFICQNTNELEWKGTPFPGVTFAVAFGNPKDEGLSGQCVIFPADYVFPPHKHPKAAYTTVLSGCLRVGFGSQTDEQFYVDLYPGQSILIPAQIHHYTKAIGDTMIQVTGYGPSETHFIE